MASYNDGMFGCSETRRFAKRLGFPTAISASPPSTKCFTWENIGDHMSVLIDDNSGTGSIGTAFGLTASIHT